MTAPPRNIPAALATAAAAIAGLTENAISLRAAIAHYRLRDPAAMADFSDDEAGELFDAALSHEPLPAGAVGEAALAYLVATRRKLAPIPFAVNALRRFGADDAASFNALAGWLHDASERAAVQADALAAYVARRGAH